MEFKFFVSKNSNNVLTIDMVSDSNGNKVNEDYLLRILDNFRLYASVRYLDNEDVYSERMFDIQKACELTGVDSNIYSLTNREGEFTIVWRNDPSEIDKKIIERILLTFGEKWINHETYQLDF